MTAFFSRLEAILFQADPDAKIAAFAEFYRDFLSDGTVGDDPTVPAIPALPSYAGMCTVLRADEVNPRKNLADTANLAAFLHAILHIEYSAVDLALDAAYRFRGQPVSFYRDWLEVADDEIRHFRMLRDLLGALGYRYGDFPVHRILFDAMIKTADSLVARMAVIPRSYEANGLDANIKMSDKIRAVSHPLRDAILAALDTIRIEEISHVAKGDRWFRHACAEAGIDPAAYFEIVGAVAPEAVKKRAFLNIEDRKKAGFTCAEIQHLALRELPCREAIGGSL